MQKKEKQESTGKRVIWRRLFMGGLWLGVALGAFLAGRYLTSPTATAQSPKMTDKAEQEMAQRQYEADKEKRIVAHIYGKVPVTREELADYLIARHGAKSLQLVINQKIVEMECAKAGVAVTPEEVNAAFMSELKQLGVDKDQFVKGVLGRYKKTLYEWKQDVIRPRLLLNKLTRGRVRVTPDELALAYEAHYGEKVKVQMIVWPIKEKTIVQRDIWPKIRKSDKEFDHYARQCYVPSIASAAGHLPPVGRHTTGDLKLEKTMFSLREGEVSEILQSPDGKMLIVVKCIKRIPPQSNIKLADKRAELEREIYEKKVSLEIGRVFDALRTKAKPKLYVKRFNPEDGIVPTKSPHQKPRTVDDPATKKPAGVTPAQSGASQGAPADAPTPVSYPKGMLP